MIVSALVGMLQLRVEISNMFYDSPEASYLKQLPCNLGLRALNYDP